MLTTEMCNELDTCSRFRLCVRVFRSEDRYVLRLSGSLHQGIGSASNTWLHHLVHVRIQPGTCSTSAGTAPKPLYSPVSEMGTVASPCAKHYTSCLRDQISPVLVLVEIC